MNVKGALRVAPDMDNKVPVFGKVHDVDAVLVVGRQDVERLEGFIRPYADLWIWAMLPSGDEFASGVGLEGDELFAVLAVVALGFRVLVVEDAELAH